MSGQELGTGYPVGGSMTVSVSTSPTIEAVSTERKMLGNHKLGGGDSPTLRGFPDPCGAGQALNGDEILGPNEPTAGGCMS